MIGSWARRSPGEDVWASAEPAPRRRPRGEVERHEPGSEAVPGSAGSCSRTRSGRQRKTREKWAGALLLTGGALGSEGFHPRHSFRDQLLRPEHRDPHVAVPALPESGAFDRPERAGALKWRPRPDDGQEFRNDHPRPPPQLREHRRWRCPVGAAHPVGHSQGAASGHRCGFRAPARCRPPPGELARGRRSKPSPSFSSVSSRRRTARQPVKDSIRASASAI